MSDYKQALGSKRSHRKRWEVATKETNQQEEIKMFDIEEMILERQESIADECHNCPYKGKCNNQCMEVEEHYNPNLRKMTYFKRI